MRALCVCWRGEGRGGGGGGTHSKGCRDLTLETPQPKHLAICASEWLAGVGSGVR